jgi:hypothetical protein
MRDALCGMFQNYFCSEQKLLLKNNNFNGITHYVKFKPKQQIGLKPFGIKETTQAVCSKLHASHVCNTR